jgi:hypothetical protein
VVAANSGEEHGRASVAQGGRRRDLARGGGVRVGFIAAHCFVEGRGRKSGHGIWLKMAGSAGDSLGCVAAARLRRPDVARRGEDSGGSTGGGRRGGATRGRAVQRQQGGAHGRAEAVACGRGETEEREREVDEGGPKCNFREMQGPYCKT